MPVLLLDEHAVARHLPMADCIPLMRRTLEALARGEALQPLRAVHWLPDRRGLVATMPAALADPPSFGVKAISVFPGNAGTRYDSHQGVVLLFEGVHGTIAAIVDASSITAIRTAAVSAAATDALATPGAGDLALLGSGVQATTHLEAMACVRPLRRVRVWSRTAEHARAFAERASARVDVRVEAMPDARSAVEGADIVCTCTSSRDPVVEGEWLAAGAHVNAIGASQPGARELDAEAVARARLWVDRRESAENEAGEYLIARGEGAIGEDHIAGEIGELFLGRLPGRRSPEEITLFKGLGLGVEDVAAAHFCWEHARGDEAVPRVDLGGIRHD